jgi:signal transduction histidine kinase/CheY-like chemotaxis protein
MPISWQKRRRPCLSRTTRFTSLATNSGVSASSASGCTKALIGVQQNTAAPSCERVHEASVQILYSRNHANAKPVGYSVIPRDVACCEVTVNLPSFADTASAHGDHRDSVFVVDDLTKHPDLKCRPYVTEFPNGRLYAGVPITSSQGVNIGAYCILDDKPREGISDRDLTFMRDMSRTVMTHMETVRALSEREQNNQMVAGLGEFVRNAPDARTKDDREGLAATNMPLNNESGSRDASWRVMPSIPPALVDPIVTPLPETPEKSKNDYFENGPAQDQQSPQFSPPGVITPMQPAEPFIPSQLPTQDPLQSDPAKHHGWQAHETARDFPGSEDTKRPDSAGSDRSTFQRAAEIMCQSLRIDGVAFLDMSVGTFGGLVQGSDSTTEDSSMTSDSTQDYANPDKIKACNVLGCAETVANGEAVRPHSYWSAKLLTGSFVRKLLSRNPGGKIWTFGEDLATQDDDGFSTDDEAGSNSSARPQTPITKERKSSRKQRRSDGENLQRAFPGARCIALHGIWDHSRRRWSVAGLYWTFDPLRVLSSETEMHFVTAFCDIVVAETRRLEVSTSDVAKSDFISSVSHELRSPLHGILGSVEILMGEQLDNATSALIEQIGSCGQSLLEIIDHLLDFSNMRSQKLTKGSVKSSKIGRKFLASNVDVSENDLSAMKINVALDDLTEDAVVSTAYSFFYGHSTDERVQTSVILDIERSDSAAWHCQLATGGWKRVVINLVANALKYTPAGFVRVSLRRKVKPGSRRRFDAVLSVTDSGKGMSQEFQRNRLFQDFSQEDSLSNGLGLGLHMVSRMVSAMGGTVAVTSNQRGSGTRMTVTIPLENHSDFKIPAEARSAPLFKSLTGAAKVGIVTVDQSVPLTRNDRFTATSWSMAIASIEKNLVFLGLQPERCNLREGNSYNLKIVLDMDLDACLNALRSEKSPVSYHDFSPTLVVCHNSPAAQKMRRAWAVDPLSTKVAADFISLPCGVKQIARAVTYTRKMFEEFNKPSLGTQGCDNIPASEPTARKMDSHDTGAQDQSLEQSAKDSPSTPDKPNMSSTEPDPSLPDPNAANSPPDDLTPPAPTTLTHLPKSRAGASHATPDGPSPTQSPTRNVSGSQPTPAADGPVLLLVDDNRVNLQLLVTFAKKNKYRYVSALDGKIALDAFETAHKNSLEPAASGEAATDEIPTVILMDINMPVMDGYEAVQRIRAYESKHHMTPAKVIAVTALQSEAAQTEAFGSGFDMFLSKPIKLKSLAKILQDG